MTYTQSFHDFSAFFTVIPFNHNLYCIIQRIVSSRFLDAKNF